MAAADDLVQGLNGLRARTSWAILSIHAANARVVERGTATEIANGIRLMEYVRSRDYWERLGYSDPSEYEFLFAWYEKAFESLDTAGEIAGWAEMAQACIMAAQAYEMTYDYAESTDQIKTAYAVHWWQFARVIRNCVNHDSLVKACRAPGKAWDAPFPVQWRDLKFVDEMEGKSLLIDKFFTKRHAFQLVEDMAESVRAGFAK